jgi:hypothetical protein
MPRRTRGWVWAGRALAAAGVLALVVYLGVAGFGHADQLSTLITALVALFGLLAPYLLPRPEHLPSEADAGGGAAPRANTVHVTNQGVQVNHQGGNVQHNVFPDRRQ